MSSRTQDQLSPGMWFEIAEARREVEETLRDEIRNALDQHKRLRLIGIGLLTLGAILLSVGNFA